LGRVISVPRRARCSRTSGLPSKQWASGFEHVVKLNYYLVDATQLPVVREVRDEFINTHQPPASTAVEVRRLVREDLLIEVDAVAMITSFQPLS
jgi:enamine deaminase RidA (YjgF/YER057c/UK114 family)